MSAFFELVGEVLEKEVPPVVVFVVKNFLIEETSTIYRR